MSCLSNRLVIIRDIAFIIAQSEKLFNIQSDILTLHYICNLIKYASGGINVAEWLIMKQDCSLNLMYDSISISKVCEC